MPSVGEPLAAGEAGSALSSSGLRSPHLIFADGSDVGPDGSDVTTLESPPLSNIAKLRRGTVA